MKGESGYKSLQGKENTVLKRLISYVRNKSDETISLSASGNQCAKPNVVKLFLQSMSCYCNWKETHLREEFTTVSISCSPKPEKVNESAK